MDYYDKLEKCLASLRQKTAFVPKIAVILGSGLGAYAEQMTIEETVPYDTIDDFPVSTVAGHKGQFVFGYVKGVPVVVMQGRVHYYEGYDMTDVVLPVRLMGLLGAKVVILTNAAGGVNYTFSAGDLMLIRDQISFVPSPLIGKNQDKLGTRFPDVSAIYDEALCELIRQVSREQGIALKEGNYVQVTGPQFETPAEVRMYRAFGGDAVGMSTACEAIAAHHMGIRVCGISCISNLACGMTNVPLTHEEVGETTARVAKEFTNLITETIVKIGTKIEH